MTVQEEAPAAAAPAAAAAAAPAAASGEPAKKKFRALPLPVEGATASWSQQQVNTAVELEASMAHQDKVCIPTAILLLLLERTVRLLAVTCLQLAQWCSNDICSARSYCSVMLFAAVSMHMKESLWAVAAPLPTR
jgi:hypothetical protein